MKLSPSDFPVLEHPACWSARSLGQAWESRWSAAEQQELRAAVGPSQRPAWPEVTAAMDRIREELEQGAGVCLIRGLDLEGVSEAGASRLLQELGEELGTPLSQSPAGERIFSVRDAGFADSDPRSRGPNTSKKLSFHTDRCDVIGFLCLQPAVEGGENEVVSSMQIYEETRRRRPDLLKVLMEPFYYLRHTVDLGNQRPWCQQPIFSFCEGHFASAFLRVLIERASADERLPELTAQQREALDWVEQVAAEPGMAVRFTQGRGDLLFLNNWVTYHRRSAFIDSEDPAWKRHILRLWLSMPNSRPLDETFRDNYGAVEAGAVRGGMPERS